MVAGHTPATIAAFENNRAYYHTRSDGSVRDPYHANDAGARRFLKLRGNAICRGVVQALFPATSAPAVAHLEAEFSPSPPPLPMPTVSLTAAGR